MSVLNSTDTESTCFKKTSQPEYRISKLLESGYFNPRIFNHELFNPIMVLKLGVKMSGVGMSCNHRS